MFSTQVNKRKGLIFVNPCILKALLSLKEGDTSYTFKSFLSTPKSSTENAYKCTKTDLLILFELLSVYIMKNNLNQMLRPRGGY